MDIIAPITLPPEMRSILQSLANNVNAANQALAVANKQFGDYVAQCAQMCGIPDFPSSIDWFFDPATAAFIRRWQK